MDRSHLIKGINREKKNLTSPKQEGIFIAELTAFGLEMQLFPESLACWPTPSHFGHIKTPQSYEPVP